MQAPYGGMARSRLAGENSDKVLSLEAAGLSHSTHLVAHMVILLSFWLLIVAGLYLAFYLLFALRSTDL